jgi:hypothetical protein
MRRSVVPLLVLAATLAAAPAFAHHQMSLFRPLVADPREGLFRLKYDRYTEDRRYGTDIADSTSKGGVLRGLEGTYWDVSFGTTVPMVVGGRPGLGRRTRWQFGIPAGLFAQFDRAGADLINADYQVGVCVDFARATFVAPRVAATEEDAFDLDLRDPVWSLRLTAYHRSTHLGDEYLSEGHFGRNQTGVPDEELLLHVPPVKRVNLSFQALRLVGSLEGSPDGFNAGRTLLRAYAGVEQKATLGLGMQPPRLRSPIYQLGGELWSDAAVSGPSDTWLSRRLVNPVLAWFWHTPPISSEYMGAIDFKLAKPYDFARGDNPTGDFELWTPHLWSNAPYGQELRRYAGSWHAMIGFRFFLREHRVDDGLKAPSAIVAWEWYRGYSPNGQFLDQRMRYRPVGYWLPGLTLTF